MKAEYNRIPVKLTEEQFKEFIFPYLVTGSRGPKKKVSLFKLFNYVLYFLYTGCQWKSLPIDKDADGKAEIHYSNVRCPFGKAA